MTAAHWPQRLYKYRTFSAQSLDSLLHDTVYYADPTTFNDPLDTQPSLKVDLPVEDMERVLRRLVEDRVTLELSVAARTMSFAGAKTQAHISARSRRAADDEVAEIAYWATHPDYERASDTEKLRMLSWRIEKELLTRYEKGILSLTTRVTCPLMWSHYGDQHRGFCIGYSVPDGAKLELRKVAYGGSRLVKASDVMAMLHNDGDACRRVDEGILFRKAKSWNYEREWRLIGPRGVADSPLELEEIVFGMRCPDAVRHALSRAMQGRERPVKFYSVREVTGSFSLRCRSVDERDIAEPYPRRAIGLLEGFEAIDAS